MIIGITGGIGSGKSAISRELERQGYAVYDCDREAKRIIEENGDVRRQIIALLGEESFRDGQKATYNTGYVAKRVFEDQRLLEGLNKIVHPAVKEDIIRRTQIVESRKSKVESKKAILFVESAILFEAGLDELCQAIVVVDAPEEVRLERTIARDCGGQMTEETINKVRARMSAQKNASCTPSDKAVLVVENDGKTPLITLAEHIIEALNNDLEAEKQ